MRSEHKLKEEEGMEAEQVPLEVPLEVPFEPSEPAPKGPSTSCQGGGELTERVCV